MNLVENTMYVLAGIEDNTLDHEKIARYAMELDPVLVFFIVKFLRDKYPASNPASTGVLERLVTVLDNHPEVFKRLKVGEKDPVSEWFLESYSIRQYFRNPEEMFQLLADKIDG